MVFKLLWIKLNIAFKTITNTAQKNHKFFLKFDFKTTLIKQVENHEEQILGNYLEQLTVSSVGIMVNHIATKLYQKLSKERRECTLD